MADSYWCTFIVFYAHFAFIFQEEQIYNNVFINVQIILPEI